MKLRHIGNQVLEDREYEDKLNEKMDFIDAKARSLIKPKSIRILNL